MKKTELVLIALAIIAVILKMLRLPFAGVLTVLSLSTLASLYFYFGVALFNGIPLRNIVKKESYQAVNSNRIVLGIGTGFAFSIALIGVLFKFQSWPMATMNLYLGIFGIVVLVFISVLNLKKNSDNFYSTILRERLF